MGESEGGRGVEDRKKVLITMSACIIVSSLQEPLKLEPLEKFELGRVKGQNC